MGTAQWHNDHIVLQLTCILLCPLYYKMKKKSFDYYDYCWFNKNESWFPMNLDSSWRYMRVRKRSHFKTGCILILQHPSSLQVHYIFSRHADTYWLQPIYSTFYLDRRQKLYAATANYFVKKHHAVIFLIFPTWPKVSSKSWCLHFELQKAIKWSARSYK